MRAQGLIGRALDRLAAGLLMVSTLMLAAMVVLINVEVAGRYIFGFSTLVADEYAGYLFTWIVLAGFLHALRSDALLRVGIVLDRLSGRPRALLDLVNALLGIVLCAIVAYAAWRTVSTSLLFQTASSHASRTPLWIPQLAMPVGMALLGVGFLERAVRHLVDLIRGEGERGRP